MKMNPGGKVEEGAGETGAMVNFNQYPHKIPLENDYAAKGHTTLHPVTPLNINLRYR